MGLLPGTDGQPWLLVAVTIMYLIVLAMFPVAAFLIVRKCR